MNSEADNEYTAWKVFKYGVISGPFFPALGLNTGKYGPEITPYLDTFDAVIVVSTSIPELHIGLGKSWKLVFELMTS